MKTVTTSVGFQDPLGNLVLSGNLVLTLSQAAEVTSGGGLIAPKVVVLPLSATTAKIASTQIYFNDELTPTGTTYHAELLDSGGNIIADFGQWSITGASADLSTMVPVTSATISLPGVVLLNPSGSALQTIAGPLTTTGTLTGATLAGPFNGNPWIDITAPAYGAKGDGQIVADAVTAVGSTTITSATANFVAGDVGKQFSATPTPYSTTGQLIGTITARNSATSITVNITSGTATASTGVRLVWGTDNTTAIQAAVTAAQALAKGGDGNANVALVPFEGLVPPIFFPAPSTGVGYVISGPINLQHQGITLISDGRDSTSILLNSPTAQLNFIAPAAQTYHSIYMHGINLEGGYVANTGMTVDSYEECWFEKISVSNCMTQGILLTNTTGTNGLNTFVDLRMRGNVVAMTNNSSQQTVFYHANIYGSTNNSNALVGFKMTGTHVINAFHGCWVEALFTVFLVDNSGGNNTTVIAFKDGRWISNVTEARFFRASSSNINNRFLLDADIEGNEMQTSAATNWNELLANANVAAASGWNIVWKHNIRDSGPTAKVFNTDSTLIHILYADNTGVNGTNISTGAGLVFGFDCGAEFQLGQHCLVRSANWSVDSTGLATFTGGVTLNGSPLLPSASGGTTIGNNVFPFSSVYVGNTFTNNIQVTGTATGTRVATLQDQTGTFVLRTGSTSQKNETGADASVLSFTPPAAVGSYRIRISMDVSAQNTATLGWTATWTDSNGSAQAPTNLSLFTSGTAAPALTVTAATNGHYYGYIDVDTNNAGTAIVVKTTFTGTSIAYKVSATVERLI